MTHFTKRDILLNRQCAKATWLSSKRPHLAAPPDEATLLRLKQGNEVDQKAREIFSGGQLIRDLEWDEACKKTDQLIKQGTSRLYQPAFEYSGLHIRVDILDVYPDCSVAIREVKMSTRPKEEHFLDVATQAFVLYQSGYTVRHTSLAVINNKHTSSNNLPLFAEVDITPKVNKLLPHLSPILEELTGSTLLTEMPEVQVGKHCIKPWRCPFYAHCWEDIPDKSVLSVPRLSPEKTRELVKQGIIELTDIPQDFPLTEKQRSYIHFHTQGQPRINRQRIAHVLNTYTYPLYFLDFETHSSPIPPYHNTHPYQQVPFQFSLHRLTKEGELTHQEYLHIDKSDPRPQVIDHLVQFIGQTGTILTYNASFEKKVLSDLAIFSSSKKEALHDFIERVEDQLPLIRKNVEHPDLNGSYSLKTVTRVLLPKDITYAGLRIANGETAHASWVRMHELENEQEKMKIISALKAYCLQDTMAQVALHRWCEQSVTS